jgi:hypothetical protein
MIHGGPRPPDLGGIYESAPHVLTESNVPFETVPQDWPFPFSFRLYDQDNSALAIKQDFVSGPEAGTGLGGFVVGNADRFTVFLEETAILVTDTAVYTASGVYVLSGRIAHGGIRDYQHVAMIIDHQGTPPGIWIAEGTGRRFTDGTRIAARIAKMPVPAAVVRGSRSPFATRASSGP